METDPLQHLKESSYHLAKEIEKIRLNQKWDEVTKSNKIMERFRGETILLPISYVTEKRDPNQFEKKKQKFCTINPAKSLSIDWNGLKLCSFNCNNLKTHHINQTIVRIKGNSLGPYFPKDYFNPKTFRILWLLKESYIEGPSFDSEDRGGWNQAEQYAKSGVKGNQTHKSLITRVRDKQSLKKVESAT